MPKITINGAKAELLKRYFEEFVKEFWNEVIKEEMVWNWHMGYLCQELQFVGKRIINREPKIHDLLINIPPGTSKSTITTIMFPAWLMAIDPTIRIISNSYSGDISTEHSVKSRDVIMSDKFMSYFPETLIRRDKKGKQNYDTTETGARYSTSTSGGITGKHAHVIINDDPQNPKQAESEAHREQSIEHTKTLSTRKVDKTVTVTITIMQRLNVEDVSGYLLGNKSQKLKHIKLPATFKDNNPPCPQEDTYKNKTLKEWYDEGGGYLDPKRLNQTALDEALVDLGSRGYAGQMDQSPTVLEGDLIKRNWFNICSLAYYLSKRQGLPVQFFMDTAFTEKKENDPTGIIAVDKIGNDIYILAARKVRFAFPKLIKWVGEWMKSNYGTEASTLRIEPKANGISLIQSLRQETDLNVTNTPSPKDDKKTRLSAQSPKIEAGRVFLVEAPWNSDFIDEVCGFPNAPHDEYVDLLVYAMDHFLSDNYGSDLSSVAAIL